METDDQSKDRLEYEEPVVMRLKSSSGCRNSPSAT